MSRGTQDICVPCDWATHATPDLDFFKRDPPTTLLYGGERETPTREKKTEKILIHL
jgi:hypothetical protein